MAKCWKYLVLIATGIMLSSAAHATVITSGSNNPVNFSWSFNSAAGVLSGNGSMTISGFNSTTLTIAVALANTSAAATSRLTSFGFGINPDLTSVAFSDDPDGGITNAVASTGGNTTIQNISGIEVCAFGGQNCAGGANGGIAGGSNDSFQVQLSRTLGWGESIDIAPIAFKYQTAVTSYEFTTDPGCATGQIGACGVTTTSLPEAPSIWLMLFAFLSVIGMAGLMRRTSR